MVSGKVLAAAVSIAVAISVSVTVAVTHLWAPPPAVVQASNCTKSSLDEVSRGVLRLVPRANDPVKTRPM